MQRHSNTDPCIPTLRVDASYHRFPKRLPIQSNPLWGSSVLPINFHLHMIVKGPSQSRHTSSTSVVPTSARESISPERSSRDGDIHHPTVHLPYSPLWNPTDVGARVLSPNPDAPPPVGHHIVSVLHKALTLAGTASRMACAPCLTAGLFFACCIAGLSGQIYPKTSVKTRARER